MSDRLDVRKTYKLYIGGKFPRSESGRSYEVVDAKGRFVANAAHGLAQGRARRGRRGPQGVPRLVGRHGVQPRSGALPGRRAARGPARPVRRRGRRGRRSVAQQGRGRRRRRHRPLGLVRRLVRQGRPGARVVQPGGRAVLQLLGAGADRRGGRARPAGVVAARPGLGRGAGHRHRQHRRGAQQRAAAAAGGHALARCSPPRTSPAVSSTSSRGAPTRSRPGWPRTWTSTPSTSPAHRRPR